MPHYRWYPIALLAALTLANGWAMALIREGTAPVGPGMYLAFNGAAVLLWRGGVAVANSPNK